MKAIKIASGFAVTALAAAISTQASAAAHEGGTETSWSFTGSMEAAYTIDMAAGATDADGEEVDTVMDMDLDEGDDFDSATAGEAWGLESTLSVVHGPFSGGVIITGNDASGDNSVTVELDDIVITDGAISFGQTGSLVETHEYAYDMGDSEIDDDGDEGRDVEAAIRYTMDGLAVQVEGANTNATEDKDGDAVSTTVPDYGIGAKYTGEADALSYIADFQLRTSSLGGDDDAAYVYVGAGATYTMDMVTAKVGLNRYTVTVDDNGNVVSATNAAADSNNEAIVEYGFEVEVTPIDALTAYLKGQNYDAAEAVAEEQMTLLVGATYTVGMISATGEYTYTQAEGGDEVFGEVVYTDGPLSAYADLTLGNLDAPDDQDPYDPQMGAGVSYTKDNGVKYAADYDMQGEVNEDGAEENVLKLSAAYAF